MIYLERYNSFKNDCNCGCNDDNCQESESKSTIKNIGPISENLAYHLQQESTLTNNVFRYGSENYINLINEARLQYQSGNIELSPIDQEIIATDIGKSAMYNGKKVWLDLPLEDDINEATYQGREIDLNKPMRDSSASKPYKVYVAGCNKKTKNNPQGIKVVRFGSGGLKAKIDDPEARKRYDSRHGCSKGKHDDKCKPGFWSCRLPRYKSLNLKGSGKWW